MRPHRRYPQVEYPPRQPRAGHGPDCPYWRTHQPETCPCCQGERKAARYADDDPGPEPAVPVRPSLRVVPGGLDRRGELTACPNCYTPVQGPSGTLCDQCDPDSG